MNTDLDQHLMSLKKGDHVCPIQEDPEHRMAVTIPLLKQGLAASERCIYAGSEAEVKEAVRAVGEAGITEGRQNGGSLEFLTSDQSFLQPGAFDPGAVIEFLRRAESAAIADGFTGLRFIGDMTWVLNERIDPSRLIEYEALLNDFVVDRPTTVLCQYDRQHFDPALIHDLLRTHPVAIVGNLFCPNPYYEPPELVLNSDWVGGDEFKRERVEWWISRLQANRTMELERDGALGELRDREERIRLLLDATDEGIFGTDLDLKCTFANAASARMLGYTDTRELEGIDMSELMHRKQDNGNAYAEGEFPIAETIHSQRKSHGDEEMFCRADGSEFPAEYWSFPVRRAGELIGAVVSFRDITEQRTLEEQLRQAQKMEAVGNLAAGIAHDFNNLLLVIRGSAELILRQSQAAELRRYANQIEDAANRAAKMTQQLLAFSSRQVLHPEPTNLNEVVEETRTMLDRLLSDQITIIYVLEPRLRSTIVDRGQIGQVIVNLAVNSREAMTAEGKITISTANVELDEKYASSHADVVPGSYVALKVADSGAGIDEDTLNHLFDPFYTTKRSGTGLGLATVYGIVAQTGGHISIESELGKGTTFTIHFPVSSAVPESPIGGSDRSDRLEGNETILLVEDHDDVRSLVTETLQNYGYTVVDVSNAADALEIATDDSRTTDLVVTDVVMPDMNGFELARALREVRPDLKLLFTSGYPEDTMVGPGEELGQSDYLAKPFRSEELAAKIRQMLDTELVPN